MTVLSMVFTIISVMLSIFEYALSSKFVRKGSVMIIKFVLQCDTIAKMGGRKFLNTIVYDNLFKMNHAISRTLGLGFVQVERLIPMQTNEGVTFMLIIDADSSRFDQIWQLFVDCVKNGSICRQLAEIYGIDGDGDECSIPENKLFNFKLNENQHLSVNMAHITGMLSQLSTLHLNLNTNGRRSIRGGKGPTVTSKPIELVYSRNNNAQNKNIRVKSVDSSGRGSRHSSIF